MQAMPVMHDITSPDFVEERKVECCAESWARKFRQWMKGGIVQRLDKGVGDELHSSALNLCNKLDRLYRNAYREDKFDDVYNHGGGTQ